MSFAKSILKFSDLKPGEEFLIRNLPFNEPLGDLTCKKMVGLSIDNLLFNAETEGMLLFCPSGLEVVSLV